MIPCFYAILLYYMKTDYTILQCSILCHTGFSAYAIDIMLDYIYISKLKPLKSKALRGNPKPLRV